MLTITSIHQSKTKIKIVKILITLPYNLTFITQLKCFGAELLMFLSSGLPLGNLWSGTFDALYMEVDHSPYLTSFNPALTESRKDTYSIHTYQNRVLVEWFTVLIH